MDIQLRIYATAVGISNTTKKQILIRRCFSNELVRLFCFGKDYMRQSDMWLGF